MHLYHGNIDFIWVSYTVATGWMEYSELEKIRSKKRKEKKLKTVK
jgi:hypothetical protein